MIDERDVRIHCLHCRATASVAVEENVAGDAPAQQKADEMEFTAEIAEDAKETKKQSAVADFALVAVLCSHCCNCRMPNPKRELRTTAAAGRMTLA
jgi:hypothetical protein